MRTKNFIETVTIGILLRLYANFRLVGDEWGRLDKILTSPDWFSLKRVSLAIKIPSYNKRLTELQALQKLPETRFPRLSASNSVSLGVILDFNPQAH